MSSKKISEVGVKYRVMESDVFIKEVGGNESSRLKKRLCQGI